MPRDGEKCEECWRLFNKQLDLCLQYVKADAEEQGVVREAYFEARDRYAAHVLTCISVP